MRWRSGSGGPEVATPEVTESKPADPPVKTSLLRTTRRHQSPESSEQAPQPYRINSSSAAILLPGGSCTRPCVDRMSLVERTERIEAAIISSLLCRPHESKSDRRMDSRRCNWWKGRSGSDHWLDLARAVLPPVGGALFRLAPAGWPCFSCVGVGLSRGLVAGLLLLKVDGAGPRPLLLFPSLTPLALARLELVAWELQQLGIGIVLARISCGWWCFRFWWANPG